MIAALWSNDGFNDDKGTRANAIQEIETNFEEAVSAIAGGGTEEEEIDKDNPFFKQMYEGQKKLYERMPASEQATVEAMVKQEEDYSKFIDQ